MNYVVEDTIVAIASPPGGAVRGVIRVSGPETFACLAGCFRPSNTPGLSSVRVPTRLSGELDLPPPIGALACHLYLWPTSRSYTRQPSAELHLVGSPPLLDAAMHVLCQRGARLAQPGEFTLRAFLAGRVDLMQAEAVLGVVDAENTRQLQVALSQLAGGMSNQLMRLRAALVDLLAHLEAGLDFVDEDIEFVREAEIDEQLAQALAAIHALRAQLTVRGDATSELCVVLRGDPNVGKSSLLNALVRSDAAIVSPLAGTTRDYVSVAFHWHDVAGVLVDTPGYDATSPDDRLGYAAQQAATEQARQARLEILCLDATRPLTEPVRQALIAAEPSERIVVWTKADLATSREAIVPDAVFTSSVTGEGLDALRALVAGRVSRGAAIDTGVVASTAARCYESLSNTAARLQSARRLVAQRGGEELVAIELHEALDQLGQMVGTVYTDDILDRIFSRFCIGK
ncbi:MAG: tRNA modification GTPase [Pirellulaceae bacterium]